MGRDKPRNHFSSLDTVSIHVYTLFLLFSRVLEHVQRNSFSCYVNEFAGTVFTPAQPYPFTDFSDSDADANVGFLSNEKHVDS